VAGGGPEGCLTGDDGGGRWAVAQRGGYRGRGIGGVEFSGGSGNGEGWRVGLRGAIEEGLGRLCEARD
jgi:hypothetical protein